jgi:quinol monooxygenase YgiN
MSHIAAFARLLEQAKKEPGTLLYAVHGSKDDPRVFWTTEVYAELIARSEVMIGETVMAKGFGR